jgi:cytochrome b
MQSVKVWDPLIRILHWGTAVLFLVGFWVFGEGDTHNAIGYALFVLILIRLLWGLVGTKYARFGTSWPSLAEIKAHFRGLFGGNTEQHLSLNPLGAVMAMNLLVAMVLISITGIMMEPYALGDSDAVEGIHTLLSDYAMICVFLHIIAATVQSRRSKSKLVKAMITGSKEINEPSS